jgi:cytochrome c oxidase assembly factor 2
MQSLIGCRWKGSSKTSVHQFMHVKVHVHVHSSYIRPSIHSPIPFFSTLPPLKMPPHLHPRSTATSTLFAGTLLASFVVVGIPHLFPCPRPRRGYADTERPPPQQLDENGQRRLPRRARPDQAEVSSDRETQQQLSPQDSKTPSTSSLQRKSLTQRRDMAEEAALFAELQREAEALEREARECPVPKPKGFIGRILGFEDKEKTTATATATTRTPSDGSSPFPSQQQSPPPSPSIPSHAIGAGSGGQGRS